MQIRTKKDKQIAEIKKLQAEISYKTLISECIRRRSGNMDRPNPTAKAARVFTCPIKIEKTRYGINPRAGLVKIL